MKVSMSVRIGRHRRSRILFSPGRPYAVSNRQMYDQTQIAEYMYVRSSSSCRRNGAEILLLLLTREDVWGGTRRHDWAYLLSHQHALDPIIPIPSGLTIRGVVIFYKSLHRTCFIPFQFSTLLFIFTEFLGLQSTPVRSPLSATKHEAFRSSESPSICTSSNGFVGNNGLRDHFKIAGCAFHPLEFLILISGTSIHQSSF